MLFNENNYITIGRLFDFCLRIKKINIDLFILQFNEIIGKKIFANDNLGISDKEVQDLYEMCFDENITEDELNLISDLSKEFWVGYNSTVYCAKYRIHPAYLFLCVNYNKFFDMYNKFHTVDEQYLFDELKLLIKKTPSKLQIMRNKRFLSQSQLAKISNTPLSTIQKLEVKDRDINKLNMIAFGKIIHALNCQPDDILEN